VLARVTPRALSLLKDNVEYDKIKQVQRAAARQHADIISLCNILLFHAELWNANMHAYDSLRADSIDTIRRNPEHF
jgi:hypothetical protein